MGIGNVDDGECAFRMCFPGTVLRWGMCFGGNVLLGKEDFGTSANPVCLTAIKHSLETRTKLFDV